MATHQRWQARIRIEGREKHIAFFTSCRAAARAYDRVAKADLGADALVNFPSDASVTPLPFVAARAARETARKASVHAKSQYIGVSWLPKQNSWRACMIVAGIQHGASGFADETEAAMARDRIALAVLGAKARLNFPDAAPAPVDAAELRRQQRAIFKATTSSQYRGVVWSRARECWLAAIQSELRQHELGAFADEEKAARAYDRAARRLHGAKAVLNFPRTANAAP